MCQDINDNGLIYSTFFISTFEKAYFIAALQSFVPYTFLGFQYHFPLLRIDVYSHTYMYIVLVIN